MEFFLLRVKYFIDCGMSKEEVDKLWVKAHNMNMMRVPARPVMRENGTPAILGDVLVFILVGKEDM